MLMQKTMNKRRPRAFETENPGPLGCRLGYFFV